MLDEIAAKLAAAEPLSRTDVEALASTSDIIALGIVADEARRRRHDDIVTFCRVADVAFSADADFRERVPATAGEVRIVGTPTSLEAAQGCVRAVMDAGTNVPVSAFSLADLVALAGTIGRPIEDVLKGLRDAGLELVAEAPIDQLQDPRTALDAARAAGVRVARLTVHQSPNADAVKLLALAKQLQSEDGHLRAYAPLPRLTSAQHPSTGYEDVKVVALARLLLDNIETIQVDWALYGPKLAQVALTFGADDVDAVSPLDSMDLGARRAPLEEIRRNIRAASFVPVERDGRFAVLQR